MTTKYIVREIKTGNLPRTNNGQPVLFNSKEEAHTTLVKDFNRINSSTRAFAKRYALSINKLTDILYVSDYEIVEVDKNISFPVEEPVD